MTNYKKVNQLLLDIFNIIIDHQNEKSSTALSGVCIQNLIKLLLSAVNERDKKIFSSFENEYLDVTSKSDNYKMENYCYYQKSDEILESFRNNANKILNNQFIHAPFENDENQLRLLLISKSLFKGKWQIRFNEKDTTKQYFYSPEEIVIPTMVNKESPIPINTIVKTIGNIMCKVYQLNYEKGGDYMMIISPQDSKSYTKKQLCKAIIPNISELPRLLLINKNFTEYDEVRIPIFQIKNTFNMNNIFKQIPSLKPFLSIVTETTKQCKEIPPNMIEMITETNVHNSETGTEVQAAPWRIEADGTKKEIKLNNPFFFCICNNTLIDTIGIYIGNK